MKRFRSFLLVISALSVIGLGACSDSDDSDTAATTTSSTTVVQSTDTSVTTTSAPEEDGTTDENTTDDTTAPNPPPPAPDDTSGTSSIAGFEEFSALQSTVPGIDTLTPVIETDNPNSRVILFQNADGRKVYKSVFVKRENRLKILNIDGGGPPLFDAPL